MQSCLFLGWYAGQGQRKGPPLPPAGSLALLPSNNRLLQQIVYSLALNKSNLGPTGAHPEKLLQILKLNRENWKELRPQGNDIPW